MMLQHHSTLHPVHGLHWREPCQLLPAVREEGLVSVPRVRVLGKFLDLGKVKLGLWEATENTFGVVR